MPDMRDVTLWPTRENFQRFRELCDDEVAADFEEFEEAAILQLDNLARQGIFIDKIAFNPDRMAQWCRAHHGKVDGEARMHYAIFLAKAS